MISSPGVYKLSSEEYHADPCQDPSLSRSTIKDLLFESAARAAYNHPRLNPDYQEDQDIKFDLGTAAHALLLEGSDNAVVIDADDWRTKAAREERDLAKKEGKTPLLKYQYEKTLKMVAEVGLQIGNCKELGITNLLGQGDSELSYIWKEEETWLRVRPDWIAKDRKVILDVKFTGGSANPEDIARQVVNMGYDIQDSLYLRGVKAVDGTDPKFVFIFIETEEPYLCSFVGLPPEFLEMGKQKVEMGIFKWRECMKSEIWPGYPDKVCWVNAPAWALASWDGRSLEMGVGK
jgi:hypothetical protein